MGYNINSVITVIAQKRIMKVYNFFSSFRNLRNFKRKFLLHKIVNIFFLILNCRKYQSK